MHSKVIIASLVCMLAASFGANNKMPSHYKKTSNDAKEMICRAPNDDGSELTIVNDMVSVGDEFRAVFTCDKQINRVRVMKTTPGVVVTSTIAEDCVLVRITPDSTRTKQAVAIGFSYGPKSKTITITKTVYIYNDGQQCCCSTLSEADVLAKYFMNFAATPEQAAALANGSPSFEGTSGGIIGPEFPGVPDYSGTHPDGPSIPPIPNPNPPRVTKSITGGKGFNFDEPSIIIDPFTPCAEENYVDFVFGDKQDMVVTVSAVTKASLPNWQQQTGTGLNAQVNWYDENNVMHPAKGASVQFYANGQVITDFRHIFSQQPMSYDYRTDASGYCGIDVMNDSALNFIEARVCADSLSTRVEDNFMIDYPFFARASTDIFAMQLSKYNEVNFTINIYAKKSERGEAFAISQKQNVPYDYCNTFAGETIPAAKTVYPSQHTFYDGANSTIMLQPDDKNSWDVLTHEYGHYIADKLGLCNISNNRIQHNVFEDLALEHGENYGRELAYTEGLATYLGIASQMFYANNYSAADYGDEVYKDTFRNVRVDYDEYCLGQASYDNADCVEARVTGILLKLLDDNERICDEISLGHQNMFNCIMDAGSGNANIHDFVSAVVDTFPEYATEVYDILEIESIPNLSIDEWTIMIYVSVYNWQDLIAADINEILSVANKPDDVNVIIEMGGFRDALPPANYPISPTNIGRYHLENQQLIRDESLPDASMADETTFYSFLEWGLTEYPARKTGIILWGPGNGLDGTCANIEEFEWEADFLNMTEVWSAIYDIRIDLNMTDDLFEFIGYDSGFMQVQDMAEQNRDFFKYMIGIQGSKTASNDWAYDEMLECVYDYENNSTLDILQTVSDCYYQNATQIGYQDASMSILDLSQIHEYRIKFETLINTIHNIVLLNNDNFEEFAYILCGPYTKHFGNDLADAHTFLEALTYTNTYSAYYYQIIDVIEGYEAVVIDCGDYRLDNGAYGMSANINGAIYYEIVTRFQYWKALMQVPNM